ncbi:hypothetical protein [Methylorubrum populi]
MQLLKANIRFDQLEADPAVDQEMIRIGTSCLVLHASEFLEALLVESDGRWFATFRERKAAEAHKSRIRHIKASIDEYEQLYASSVLWPLEYSLIEALPDERRLQVRTGVIGSAPIYCYCTSAELVISWSLSDFRQYTNCIDTEALVAALSLSTQYSARQILHGVYMMTERATYTVSPDGACFRYPEPKTDSGRFDRISSAEYSEILDAEIRNIISLRPLCNKNIAVELSGGVDSAAVAVALRQQKGSFCTFGVVLQNETAAYQIARRDRLVKIFKANDHIIRLSEHMPNLEPDYALEERHGALEEFYIGAFSALWDTASSVGSTAIYKGFGGDELGISQSRSKKERSPDPSCAFEEHQFAFPFFTVRTKVLASSLRVFDAPESPVPHSSLLAQARHAPHALKRGLWPVNPLCDPRLVDLSLRLPHNLRVERRFLRDYVNNSIDQNMFVSGYVKETFRGVLGVSIASSGEKIKAQLKTMLLSDLDLIDRSSVISAIDYVSLSRCETTALQLSVILLLERFLRSTQMGVQR